MREMLLRHKDILIKLDEIEKTVINYGSSIAMI
jgi:hypothetical protein